MPLLAPQPEDPDMTSPFSSPLSRSAQPVSTAGNSLNTTAFVAPRDGVVSAVTYTTPTAITGANTNTRSVSLVNKGQNGSGTTVVASIQFNSGVNTTASVPKTVTLSSTASDRNVTAGDVLQWQSTAVGTGIADPGGLVTVSLSTSYA